MTTTFTLSIEPQDGKAYQHGFHLGTIEETARSLAEEIFHHNIAKPRTVALIRDRRIYDVYDGRWSSDGFDD
jgi:hypothetical protein